MQWATAGRGIPDRRPMGRACENSRKAKARNRVSGRRYIAEKVSDVSK
jgi:hypothetical protein